MCGRDRRQCGGCIRRRSNRLITNQRIIIRKKKKRNKEEEQDKEGRSERNITAECTRIQSNQADVTQATWPHAQASGVTSLSCCFFFYRRVNIIRSGLCSFSFLLYILVEIKTTRKRTSSHQGKGSSRIEVYYTIYIYFPWRKEAGRRFALRFISAFPHIFQQSHIRNKGIYIERAITLDDQGSHISFARPKQVTNKRPSLQRAAHIPRINQKSFQFLIITF